MENNSAECLEMVPCNYVGQERPSGATLPFLTCQQKNKRDEKDVRLLMIASTSYFSTHFLLRGKKSYKKRPS